MSPLVTITRTLLIGAIWSVLFFKGIQDLMTHYWGFNLLLAEHWLYIWKEWVDGWVIDEPNEIAFVLILFTFIPVWLTGWTAFCIIPWGAIVFFPFRLIKSFFAKPQRKVPVIKRKKSYKKTRPPPLRGKIKKPTVEKEPVAAEPLPAKQKPMEEQAYSPKPQREEKSEPKKSYDSPKPEKTKDDSSVADIFENAGYSIIQSPTINGNKIDYLAISSQKVFACIVDSEDGDWLADEERFNDEEPLWFSESNHRISPVKKVLDAKEALSEILSDEGIQQEAEALLVINQGTIINAEDMFEIWEGLDVTVGRTGDGGPEEIKILSKVLPPNDEEVDESDVNAIKNAVSKQ